MYNGTHKGSTYGVTCGHCLTDENHIMYPKETTVNQPSPFTSFLLHLHLADAYDHFVTLKELSGRKVAVERGLDNSGLERESVIDSLKSRSKVIGVIEGGRFGPLESSSLWMDYGLVKIDSELEIQPTISVLLGGLSSPPLHLDLDNDIIDSSVSLDSAFNHTLLVYGQGATSREVSAGYLGEIEGETFVRVITLQSEATYHCFLTDSVSPFNKGDSGTWFWTCNWGDSGESDEEENKRIIGMGFAIVTFKDRQVTCILPIKEILSHSLATLQKQTKSSLIEDSRVYR
jgi:hypothetical protein